MTTQSTAQSETARQAAAGQQTDRRTSLIAVGGLLAALGATTCCVVPFALFTAGITGAWIGNLSALAPYQSLFVVLAIVFLGAGFHRIYRRPIGADCDTGYCARPIARRVSKIGLWTATGIVAVAVAWPLLLPLMVEPVVVVK